MFIILKSFTETCIFMFIKSNNLKNIRILKQSHYCRCRNFNKWIIFTNKCIIIANPILPCFTTVNEAISSPYLTKGAKNTLSALQHLKQKMHFFLLLLKLSPRTLYLRKNRIIVRLRVNIICLCMEQFSFLPADS